MKEKKQPKEHPIKIVPGSTYCLYSIIENNQNTISKNQKVLYDKLEEIAQVLVSEVRR